MFRSPVVASQRWKLKTACWQRSEGCIQPPLRGLVRVVEVVAAVLVTKEARVMEEARVTEEAMKKEAIALAVVLGAMVKVLLRLWPKQPAIWRNISQQQSPQSTRSAPHKTGWCKNHATYETCPWPFLRVPQYDGDGTKYASRRNTRNHRECAGILHVKMQVICVCCLPHVYIVDGHGTVQPSVK